MKIYSFPFVSAPSKDEHKAPAWFLRRNVPKFRLMIWGQNQALWHEWQKYVLTYENDNREAHNALNML